MKKLTSILKFITISFVIFQLFSFTTNIPPSDSVRITKNAKGTFIYLSQKIHFDLNETSIENGCKRQLYLIIHYLKKNPDLKIEVGVHNDLRSKDDLSQTRADIIKSFFTTYGIDAERIEAIGYNTKVLINKCSKENKCTEREHAANRRVEIKISNPGSLKEFIVVNTAGGELVKN